MKKFTKIFICLLLCVFSFGLVACGDDRTQKEKDFDYPSRSDEIVGNGGLAVKKGDYIYFVNGYQSIENITNKNSSHLVGSLMLMKLGENGEVVVDEDGLLKDEYYITMSSALCGYQATNIYVFGDYLYFVTPCLENESGDKVWAKERVEFKRIKLNKTGEVEDVYSSDVKYDQLEFKYYEENGNLYILAWEKGESYYADNGNNALIRINATASSNSIIATDVSSVVFAENASEIFFVEDDSENSKYDLKQYNIAEDEITDYASFDKSVTAKFVADGKVYITKAHNVGSTTDIEVSTISSKSGFEFVSAYEGTNELTISKDGCVIVMVSGTTISLIRDNEANINIVDSSATAIKVIGFTNGCVVYYDTTDSNTIIKMVSYYNHINGGDAEIKTIATLDKIEDEFLYFDLDDSFLYFYQMEGSNYYLNRLKINNNLEEVPEMIGVYDEEDAPVIEEEEEVEEE